MEQDSTFGLWRILTSMRTGLIILFVLAAVAMVGTFLPQQQPFYHSWWFNLILAVLAIDLLACTASRLKGIYKAFTSPGLQLDIAAYKNLKLNATWREGKPVREVVERLHGVMVARGYRVCTKEGEGISYLYGEKGRFGLWGSSITHLAFVILLVGALIGSLYGFKGEILVQEGHTFKLDQITLQSGKINRDFSVRVNRFEDRFNPDGSRDNWYSDLSVLDEGREVLRRTISVNHPMAYRGVTFYQAFYAYGARLAVTSGGKTSTVVLKAGQDFYHILGAELGLYIADEQIQPAPVIYYQVFDLQTRQPVADGQAQPGQRINLPRDGSFVFLQPVNYTGLQIKRDPGVPVVWVGCFFLVAGMLLSFYLRRRQIWVAVTTDHNQTVVMVGGRSDKGQAAFQQEFAGLTAELKG